MSQWINQSIYQFIKQPMNEWMNHSINESMNQPNKQSINLYGQYERQSELHVCRSRNVCIDMQEVSMVPVYWAPVYRRIWHRLVHMHACRLIHGTILHNQRVQSTNPWINRWINHRLANQPVNQSFNLSISRPIIQRMNQLTNESICQSINQLKLTTKAMAKLTHQAMDQWINQT